MLAAVDVHTLAQLKRKGAIATYVAAKRRNKSVSLNLLYGIISAVEEVDWREVQRERKLELVIAVEDYERLHPIGRKESVPKKKTDELSQLRNIGQAMRKDFELLNIRTVEQLAKQDADKLFARIQTLMGSRHDPCVWDTYAAAIHQAKTGEALPWWHFTKIRKERERKKSKHDGLNTIGPTRKVADSTLFKKYPANIRSKLLRLRKLIYDVAAATPEIGPLTETLKWGQPSYLPEQTRSGTTIRIDQVKTEPKKYAMYFHCQTTLVEDFRKMFEDDFEFVGNRCIIFDVHERISESKLRQCIELALTYHQRKNRSHATR